MIVDNSTAHEISSNSADAIVHFTTQSSAFFDPTWQLALTIAFCFQCAIIAIGVFGTAANALVLYALVAYHLQEAKKRAINLLMINQNLLDLTSCVLLIVAYCIRVSNIYLTGAMGYFLCSVFMNDNATSCALYASLINLTPATQPTQTLYMVNGFPLQCTLLLHHQSNDCHRRTLPEGGPSFLEQEVSQAMDDIRGDGVRLDLRHLVRSSGGVFLDSSEAWSLPAVRRVGIPVWEYPLVQQVINLWVMFSYFVVPVILFVFCYARIVVVMRRQMRAMAAHNGAGQQNTSQMQPKRIK